MLVAGSIPSLPPTQAVGHLSRKYNKLMGDSSVPLFYKLLELFVLFAPPLGTTLPIKPITYWIGEQRAFSSNFWGSVGGPQTWSERRFHGVSASATKTGLRFGSAGWRRKVYSGGCPWRHLYDGDSSFERGLELFDQAQSVVDFLLVQWRVSCMGGGI